MVDGLPATRKTYTWKGKVKWVVWQWSEKRLYEKVSDGGWITSDQENLYMKR